MKKPAGTPVQKPAETPAKKLGAMLVGVPMRDGGPNMSVEVSAVRGGERSLQMVAFLDTLSELDGVGQNWLPHLEACGGTVVHL